MGRRHLAPRGHARSENATNDFGEAVALEGDRLVVGAPNEGGYRGAAYVFEHSGGVWTQTLRWANPVGAGWDDRNWRAFEAPRSS